MSNQATYTTPITSFKKHGLVGTSEYWAWRDIKKRCYNPNNKWYCNYGGRGIKMHEPWITSFQQFYQDVGKKPAKGYSLDRIDNDGDYEPDNVRWATKQEQDNNRRTNVFIEEGGVSKTYKQWADHFGVRSDRLRYYILKGLKPSEAAEKTRG